MVSCTVDRHGHHPLLVLEAGFGGSTQADTARSVLTMAELEERDQELRREGYMAASARGNRGA